MNSLDKSGEGGEADEDVAVFFPRAPAALQDLIRSGKYRLQYDLLADDYYSPANVATLSQLCERPVEIQARASEAPQWLLELGGDKDVMVRDLECDRVMSASAALALIHRKMARQRVGLYTIREALEMISNATGADAPMVEPLLHEAIQKRTLVVRSQGGGCPIAEKILQSAEPGSISRGWDHHGPWVIDITELNAWVFETFLGQRITVEKIDSEHYQARTPESHLPQLKTGDQVASRTKQVEDEGAKSTRRRLPTVQWAIYEYVSTIMRDNPHFTGEELYKHMRRHAGTEGSPFSRIRQGEELFCIEASKTCGQSSVRAALTKYKNSAS